MDAGVWGRSLDGLDRPSAPPVAASEARLREIFELAPIGIGVVDLHGRTVLSNDALRGMLGYSAEEFASVSWEAFTHPDDVHPNQELFGELAAGGIERFELDKRFFHRDGRIVWGHLTASLIRDDQHRPLLVIGMLEDVTEERRLAAQLAEAEATYRSLVEEVPAVVYVSGASLDGTWTYVSPQIETLLGFTPEAWLADPGLWWRQLQVDDRADVLETYHRRVATPAVQAGAEAITLHYRMHRADGREVWIRDEFRLERDHDGREVFRGVLVDVTREKQLETRLERLAFHDPLTTLANRELFRDRVHHTLERRTGPAGHTGAVLFVDLDDFKTVNDSLGHAAGDDLLCSVAGRLQGCIRPGDTAGRLGGDEFGVLLEELDDPQDAVAIAERLVAALERPHQLHGREVLGSASVGIAYLADAGSTEAALRNADLAMYQAKASGKGRIATYEPDLHTAALRRLDLRSALGRALGAGELALHYQPIVELASGELVGVEALLRWHHPEFGDVPPEDFVPIAEETGAIVAIGDWVLRTACRWLATHTAGTGRPTAVSVNVSPVQLQDGFLDAVADALGAAGLAPDRLLLEVTERALLSARSWELLRRLKAAGVRVAIDDFGTGYSSLAYLGELSVDVLKLDRAFTAGLGRGGRAEAVPVAVIELARALGLAAVAEGVETVEQRDRLLELGCAWGQGFLYAPPRPVVPRSVLDGVPYVPGGTATPTA